MKTCCLMLVCLVLAACTPGDPGAAPGPPSHEASEEVSVEVAARPVTLLLYQAPEVFGEEGMVTVVRLRSEGDGQELVRLNRLAELPEQGGRQQLAALALDPGTYELWVSQSFCSASGCPAEGSSEFLAMGGGHYACSLAVELAAGQTLEVLIRPGREDGDAAQEDCQSEQVATVSEGLGAPTTSDRSRTSQATSGSMAAALDYGGRRYDLSCGAINPDLVEPSPFATGRGDSGASRPLHRIRGVDPNVLVAVRNDGCELAPDQAWQSAFAASEYRGGPSAAYNEAWCAASLYGPDPAEGFSC